MYLCWCFFLYVKQHRTSSSSVSCNTKQCWNRLLVKKASHGISMSYKILLHTVCEKVILYIHSPPPHSTSVLLYYNSYNSIGRESMCKTWCAKLKSIKKPPCTVNYPSKVLLTVSQHSLLLKWERLSAVHMQLVTWQSRKSPSFNSEILYGRTSWKRLQNYLA